MNWSPRDAWDALRADVANGATCVISVAVPPSVDLPPAMTASLKDHERNYAARLQLPMDRHLYVVAHYLMARSVRAIADPKIVSWSFESDRTGGKPRLVVEHRALHASLSHTRGAVAVAFSRVADVGVDVEAVTDVDAVLDHGSFGRKRRSDGRT